MTGEEFITFDCRFKFSDNFVLPPGILLLFQECQKYIKKKKKIGGLFR